MTRTVCGILLAALVGTAVLAGVGTIGDPIDRQVSEIFIGTDDIFEGMPELVAQLEVSAGIEMGRIDDPKWPTSLPPGQKYMDWMPIPPPRGMTPFEFRQGTVKEALDAFCRLNPGLTWSQGQGGVVNLVRHSEGGEALKNLLDLRVTRFNVKSQPPKSAAAELATVVRAAEPRAPPESQGRWWHLFVGPVRGNDCFPPRCAINTAISLDGENAAFRSLLDEFARQTEAGFWIAIDEQSGAAPGEKRPPRGVVALTDASLMRRKLDASTLIRCLDSKYQPLHGYLDANVRAEDAKRELRRRYHFHPDLVRPALIEGHAIQSMLEPNAFRGADRLIWLFSLEDGQLTKLAIEAALQMKDKDARHRMVRLFPDPCSKGFESDYLPIWQRLLSDSDPRVRQYAETIMEWYQERQGRLRRQPSL